jgi:lipoate-protein ligase A
VYQWLLLRSGFCAPAFNMALDEALLAGTDQTQKPVLRFYGWTEPAASFGYFQKFGVVEKMTALRPLIRRPTAGGLVPHDADWTYSLAFPTTHEWYAVNAVESYRRAHEWLRRGFESVGIETQLASSCLKSAGQCFLGNERYDLLWRGTKIAGAAQRRTKTGLLIQGSVQPSKIRVEREEWEQAMQKASPYEQGITWNAMECQGRLKERAMMLEEQKYSQAAYNQSR